MAGELRYERDANGIVTLWLDAPQRPVVVLDKELIGRLHSFFDELESEADPRGLILMSANERVFVAGADLAEIDSLGDEELHAYLEEAAHAFMRIAGLCCPTVACIGGAALGGGLEVAMHCDFLIAWVPADSEKPYRVGLPEAGLGLCPGWGGTQMFPARIEPMRAIRLTAEGFTPKVSEIGELFAQEVAHKNELRSAATEIILQHDPEECMRQTPICIDSSNRERIRAGLESVRGDLPDTPAARAVVECIETGLEFGWEQAIAKERELLVGLRHTEIARKKLEAFFAGAR